MLTDTHTHLFASEFDEDREAVINRALDSGVSRMLLPNIDLSSIPGMIRLASGYPGHLFPMLGLHPCSVTASGLEDCVAVLENFEKAHFAAIGEIGLDFYWDTTYAAQQEEVFRHQLRFAKEKKLPVAIHTRNSFERALEIVREEHDSDLSGVFHCFGGSAEDAARVIELGNFFMGIGGVITFKNSNLSEVVGGIPAEYLLLETDSPYLAPVPYRGKRNESSYLPLIAARVAEAKGISAEELARITTANADRLFKLNANG